MTDIRLSKYAKTLINYSLSVKKYNRVIIQGYPAAMPLIEECFHEVINVGAYPYVILRHDLNEILLKDGKDHQISFVSPISETITATADKLLNIGGGYNTKYMSSIDPEKLSMFNKAHGKIGKIHNERTNKGLLKWSLCMYPTQSLAQEAGMSLHDYTEFIYEACLLNHEDPISAWKEVSRAHEKIIAYLESKEDLKVKSEGTDISMKIKGRKWINSDGQTNFPSGEVFSAPIENSVNGIIRFSFPGIYGGQEVEDIRLKFKNGIVTDATASKGEQLLNTLLKMDNGSNKVGEIAIGTNYNITKFTRNMLFDEKIGGTVHMALGKAYAQSGGINESGIHWDMLCDMKNGGEIYADGECFYRDGKVIEEVVGK